ncbi:hypothetical protein TTHERM_000197741 (macronuclear) [Tetrahymena thermophila SB210]|uniref:Uncharacterized protein n=1 Tax=Tetrahymena thermophila (strain SB210) TaxID=312017 RepID=W7XLN9_TETTS|nr:hypothetical protein TTHERM_000197741 [Tetrahymena thermophila SB210]EWS76619.1 hypothetical protein TTHERM_000197741 [Tetrahymena thermophila SB210]|eukprot:XP_012650787.1 hypothetical protein TTHERM_000197741 [Tetrahymena thermophila SB210]
MQAQNSSRHYSFSLFSQKMCYHQQAFNHFSFRQSQLNQIYHFILNQKCFIQFIEITTKVFVVKSQCSLCFYFTFNFNLKLICFNLLVCCYSKQFDSHLSDSQWQSFQTKMQRKALGFLYHSYNHFSWKPFQKKQVIYFYDKQSSWLLHFSSLRL